MQLCAPWEKREYLENENQTRIRMPRRFRDIFYENKKKKKLIKLLESSMGVGNGGQGGGRSSPVFSHMIGLLLMFFSIRIRFVKTSQLSPAILVLCCAGSSLETGVIKDKRGPKYTKMTRNFLKR